MKKDCGKQYITEDILCLKETELNEVLIINTIMNNSQDTVYFKDRNSNFILTSKAQAMLFDIENPLEVIGKNDYEYFPKYFADNAFKDEAKIMATGEPIIGRVEKLIKSDGRIVWLSASKYPLYNSRGEIIGTWGTSRDITSLKKAEEELLELNRQLEEANRQLRVLSAIDHLSGLYNHRYFFEELKKAWGLYERQKEKGNNNIFSIILFDIDNFKNINDTYGHLTGDVAIRHIGETMKVNTRSIDDCFRYGGDEFAVLLYDTNVAEAKIVADKIRRAIEATSISEKHIELKLTASVGVSSSNEAESFNDLFKKADEKLYRSKKEGKNKVT